MYIWSEKIPVGISACMYGCHVRYNRKGWDMIKHIGRDQEMFVFHPMCPEVQSGMGVPRPSIRIKGESGLAVWDQGGDIVDSHGRYWSFALKDACRSVLDLIDKQNIKVYIFMEGSPTCGVHRTSLKGKRMGKPPGVLGAKLLEKGLFLIDGMDLQSPIKWWDIQRRMLAYLYLQQYEITSKAELYDLWHNYKFICQEIENVQSRALGHRIANLPHQVSSSEFSEIKLEILDILRKPSTSARIRQMLWKHYTYLRKHKGIVLEEVLSPEDVRGMQRLAKELQVMARASVDADVLYGQVPVIYRR